jgi:Na+-translocating ferredoxin:NAD+ oxidoreductase RNF subunit RnfB
LTGIRPTKERGRCTACKRRRGVAIAEQAAKGEPCPWGGCEFAAEIAAEIENRSRISIVPKEKKRIHITEKQRPQVDFIRRK